MCIDTVSLPNVSQFDDISLHLYLLLVDVLQQRRSNNVSRKGKRRSAEAIDSNRTGAVVSDNAVVTAGMDDVSSQFGQLYSYSSSSEEDDDEEEEEERYGTRVRTVIIFTTIIVMMSQERILLSH